MEKYKLRDFARWAKKHRLADKELIAVIDEMEAGLLGDPLGASIYKKRVATGGKGKRGGARSIVLFKSGDVAVFLYGYLKSEKSNITLRESEALRVFVKDFIKLSTADRALKREEGVLIALEDNCDETKNSD